MGAPTRAPNPAIAGSKAKHWSTVCTPADRSAAQTLYFSRAGRISKSNLELESDSGTRDAHGGDLGAVDADGTRPGRLHRIFGVCQALYGKL
ncbi:hypothetical protein ColTof4_00313 [Colletotrichum tofieldiae]|nr:hypothetical protein ColTof3_07519 [Colletotrichum tofieldiae]GKT67890.1 hypothetical protein ColTof4_00313 [Colletotrichum tofieldiae]